MTYTYCLSLLCFWEVYWFTIGIDCILSSGNQMSQSKAPAEFCYLIRLKGNLEPLLAFFWCPVLGQSLVSLLCSFITPILMSSCGIFHVSVSYDHALKKYLPCWFSTLGIPLCSLCDLLWSVFINFAQILEEIYKWSFLLSTDRLSFIHT